MKQTPKGCWVIEDDNDADQFGRIVAGRPWVVGVDVETRPEDGKRKTPKAWVDPLVGVGVSFYDDDPDDMDAAPVATFYGSVSDTYLRELKQALGTRKWYAHNAMFDALVVRRYGITLGEHIGDPRIIAYLSGLPEAGLKVLLWEWLQYDIDEYEMILERHDALDLTGVPVMEVADYCGSQDAAQVVRLERNMRRDLADNNPRAFDVYTKVELPMVPILVEMTNAGIRFDREEALRRYATTTTGRENLDRVIDKMVKDAGFVEYEKRGGEIWLPTCKSCRNGAKKKLTCEDCGGKGKLDPVVAPFNPGSWQQRGRFLYDHLGIPKRRFAGGVQPWQIERGWYEADEVAGSTDALAMLQVRDRHPVVPMLLTRTKLAKDEGFLAKWSELSIRDGRLHTEFTNTTVASGRLSSREPNLQQVTMRFRDLFLPDDDEWEIVAGDMSQLELVIGAYVSRDKVMMEIIRNGWDMHCITAEAVYGIDWRAVRKDDPTRNTAKVVNYLSSYGGQAHKLIEGIEKLALSRPELGLTIPSLAEAKRIIAAAKRKYAGYWSWADVMMARTRTLGYAETAFGRPRWLPDIRSEDDEARSSAQRQAVNHAIQGTAADLMKMAMVNISRDKVMSSWGYMVLQVHDEIVSVVRKKFVPEYMERLRSHMALGQPFEPIVPLTVDVTHGPDWKNAHK